MPSSECLLRIAPIILSAKLMSKKIPEACDPAEKSIQRSKASGLWLSIENPLGSVPLSMEGCQTRFGSPGSKNHHPIRLPQYVTLHSILMMPSWHLHAYSDCWVVKPRPQVCGMQVHILRCAGSGFTSTGVQDVGRTCPPPPSLHSTL